MQTITRIPSDYVAQPRSIAERIEAAITEARQISDWYGVTSKESAVAWDTVEELQAEASHQKAKHDGETAFSHYCEEFPDAPEARIYDV